MWANLRGARLVALVGCLLSAKSISLASGPQTWIELRSPHFIVVTNASEHEARLVANQFEAIRAVFLNYFGDVSASDQPVVILAARNEDTFKQLLPEAWAQKESARRVGFYLSSADKNYVCLRVDASLNPQAYEPFEPIYHEYFHYLTRRMFSQLPLWVVEGLAEFFGNTRIEPEKVFMGAPSTSNLAVLRQQPLLSLNALFEIDASSPYYNEQNKASIFYAESWALTHYLMAQDWRQRMHRMNDFVVLLGQHVPQTEAARRTIGDPETLEKSLRDYIHNSQFTSSVWNVPGIEQGQFQTRVLSDAESLAIRGDFMAHNRRYAEAQQMLEESLKLDPKPAAAWETMGFLYVGQGNKVEAAKWYSEAVARNSQSYLANYYYAESLLKGKLDDDSAAKAESSLRAALNVNPDIAVVYDDLAFLLVSRNQRLDEAYKLVLRAQQLEPKNIRYRAREVEVLERLGRSQDAVDAAIRILPTTRTPEDRALALTALAHAEQFLAYQNYEAFKREHPFIRIPTIRSAETPTAARASAAVLPRLAHHGNPPKIAPPFADVALGAKQQFSVANLPTDKKVIWKVSGSGCSGAACGTISADGLYRAPVKAPSPPAVTVTAAPADAPGAAAFALVSILPSSSK
ncbi:MAG TPA: DUF1570 domain-containing protein [Candidatus Nitrosotalea sp.]|nr:DUF1570 domain-containing protein [Candidatus Nitrosotalea sp.]